MSAPRLALAASLLLAACGSSRPADSSADSTAPLGEPADAGVSIGRPSSRDAGAPDLPAKVVPNSILEPKRTAGTRDIAPDEADRKAMDAGGKNAVAVVKLCVKASGAVVQVQLIKSSGYPTWDEKILREMKSWTYGPITVDGNPADVCAPVTFAYKPSAPAPPAPPSPKK